MVSFWLVVKNGKGIKTHEANYATKTHLGWKEKAKVLAFPRSSSLGAERKRVSRSLGLPLPRSLCYNRVLN